MRGFERESGFEDELTPKNLLSKMRKFHQDYFSDIIDFQETGELTKIKDVADDLEKWANQITIIERTLAVSDVAGHLEHDVDSDLAIVNSELNLLSFSLQKDRIEKAQEHAKKFTQSWERAWVVLEDLLLRKIDENSIALELIGELDIDQFERVVNYFQEKEMKDLNREGRDSRVAYLNLDQKKFHQEVDWNKIKKDLQEKEIKANNGLICNFVLNSLRNALKDRIEASDVYLNVSVEEDQLMISIMDNGKGIDAEALDLDSKDFIHKKGTSRTGSTGLGLVNFNKRVSSVGGDELIVSRRGDEGVVNGFRSSGLLMNPEQILEEINHNRRKKGEGEVNTVFEIRIPLENK